QKRRRIDHHAAFQPFAVAVGTGVDLDQIRAPRQRHRVGHYGERFFRKTYSSVQLGATDEIQRSDGHDKQNEKNTKTLENAFHGKTVTGEKNGTDPGRGIEKNVLNYRIPSLKSKEGAPTAPKKGRRITR